MDKLESARRQIDGYYSDGCDPDAEIPEIRAAIRYIIEYLEELKSQA